MMVARGGANPANSKGADSQENSIRKNLRRIRTINRSCGRQIEIPGENSISACNRIPINLF